MIVANQNLIPKTIYRHGHTHAGVLLQDYVQNMAGPPPIEEELDALYSLEQLRALQFKLRGFKTSLVTNGTHFVYLGTYYQLGNIGGKNLMLIDNGCIRIEDANNASIYPATPAKTFAGTEIKMGAGNGHDTLRSIDPARREQVGLNSQLTIQNEVDGWLIYTNEYAERAGIRIEGNLSFHLMEPGSPAWKNKGFIDEINTLLTTFFNIVPCMAMVTGQQAELVLL